MQHIQRPRWSGVCRSRVREDEARDPEAERVALFSLLAAESEDEGLELDEGQRRSQHV